jgi:uncharacterized protein (DUF736 family)
MSNVGTFQKTQNGFKGSIRTLQVNVPEVLLTKIDAKRGNNSPDYRVMVAGHEIGAAWNKVSTGEEKKKYISVTMDDPSFPHRVNCSLFEREDGKGYDAVWNRPRD